MQNKLFFLTGDFSEGQTHKKHPEKKKLENDTSVMFKQNTLTNNGQKLF